jgi:hypothetical protein
MARRHPTLKILMAHFGNPWWEEAWKITFSNPNVYADLSGGTAIRRSMLMWRELFAPDGNQDSRVLAKLLFATDVLYLANPGSEGFESYCTFYDRLYDAVNASDEQRERINRGAVECSGWGERARRDRCQSGGESVPTHPVPRHRLLVRLHAQPRAAEAGILPSASCGSDGDDARGHGAHRVLYSRRGAGGRR